MPKNTIVPSSFTGPEPSRMSMQRRVRSCCAVAAAVVAMLVSTTSQAAIPSAERAALMALYESTNGPEWLISDGWWDADSEDFGAPGTECDWYGVGCDLTRSHIRALYLVQNNMQGPIPSEIGALQSLNELVLSTNAITGPLPDEFFTLPLDFLSLAFNQIGGSIPAAFGSMNQLKMLNLSDNLFTGGIPPELGNLARLEQLSLDKNPLEGGIPPELGQLRSLRGLTLTENGLTGPIPAELGNLANVTNIMIMFTELEGEIPPELGQLRSCEFLALGYNQLEGSIPAAIGQLTSLTFFDLEHNQLTGPIPPELGQLRNLRHLGLARNQLTGPIPPELGDLVALERLYLAFNQLSGPIPPQLGKLSALRSFAVTANSLEGNLPPEIGMLRQLETLGLAANKLSGEVPRELLQLTNLNLFAIDLNGFISSDPEVRDFLDRKHMGPWELTQSLPPTDLAAQAIDSTSVEMTWTPVPETAFDIPKHTTALVARAPNGPFVPWGETEEQEDDRLVLTGLLPGVTYVVAAQTTVAPHEYNSDAVRSVLTDTVTVTMPGAAPPVASLGDRVTTVPAVAHVAGALGTRWLSDVVVHNPGVAPAEVDLAFGIRDQSGGDIEPLPWSVAAGSSLRLVDVVAEMTASEDAAGLLMMGSSADLIVSSRTFNDSSIGTFGQYIPGEHAAVALTTRSVADLVQLTSDASFRTNIGIANPGSAATRATVELIRADGDVLGSDIYDVPAFGAIQLNDVFSSTVVEDGRARVTTSTPGAQLHTYASVVDNRSGDPVYVRSAQPAWDQLWIPGVAHLEGANQTSWRSDVEVFNPGPDRATYRLEFFLRDGDPVASSAARFILEEGEARRHLDLVHEIFGVTGAGAIRIRLEQGRVAASCRTFNDAADGSFGQFIPAEPVASALHALTPARLVQLAYADDGVSGFRTNIGVVNTTAVPVLITAELYDDGGNQLGVLTAELGPFGNTQLNNVFRTLVDEDVDDGYAVLYGDNPLASFLAYASVVDNRSGDPVYISAAALPEAQ